MSELGHDVRSRLLGPIDRVAWLAPLIGRLAVGLMFASTGWGKVHSLDQVTGFFDSLGIPWPGFNAALVGYSELCCGALLVLGLLTRLAAIPLMVVMCVALLTARWGDIGGVFDLVAADEFTYFCVLSMIALLGPGVISLDSIAFGRGGRFRGQPTRDEPGSAHLRSSAG